MVEISAQFLTRLGCVSFVTACIIFKKQWECSDSHISLEFVSPYVFADILYSVSLLMQYSKFVKPAFDDFILPTKKYADIIIPRGGDNHVAVDLIVQHICTKLGQHDLCKIYPNLYVIHSTFQVTHISLSWNYKLYHLALS